MLNKNTILDLWDALTDVPVIINSENVTVIDDPAGFMGWPYGTNVEEIWHWFDEQFRDYGGVHVLMYDHPEPELRFSVETPDGVLEASAGNEGHDEDAHVLYPGIDIRLIRENEEELYDLVCRVEHNGTMIQSVTYGPDHDEPVGIHSYQICRTFEDLINRYGKEIVTLDAWDADGNEIPEGIVIPNDAKILEWSRGCGSFEVTFDMHVAGRLPERISRDMIRRGLTDGDIVLCTVDSTVVAEIGEHWFYFGGNECEGVTASVHIDTTRFEDDVEAIWEAVNAEPINGPTEEEATECLYYLAFLSERFTEREKVFMGKPRTQYPIEEQIDNCYKYLNWQDSHKSPYDMTEDELLEAQKELDQCEPGIAWVAHAGYAQMVPQDKNTGKLILG